MHTFIISQFFCRVKKEAAFCGAKGCIVQAGGDRLAELSIAACRFPDPKINGEKKHVCPGPVF
ncbi:MAG: hypothetical protein IK083_09940 [Abditibacteriota bacterium]|nr:hypothetical protein [Abditibacteriota bacterium]